MAKILLVEDDNNLREIYEARLMAEGYDIVSARDGEEALSVAIKEKPDLVISDVMMPKISGFDMLDILRTTEETKNVKVIMMTALSQAEDKARAEKLGADRYLVKSQVTLEDVAKVAKEVLEGSSKTTADTMKEATATPAAVPASEPTAVPAPVAIVSEEPAVVATDPVVAPTPDPVAPSPTTQNPVEQTTKTEEQAIADQIEGIIAQSVTATATPAAVPASEPTAVPAPVAIVSEEPAVVATDPVVAPAPDPVTPTPAPVASNPDETTAESTPDPEVKSDRKVIEPIVDPNASSKPSINELLAKEEANEQSESVITQGMGTVMPNPLADNEEKIDPNSIAL
jgi:CheY-like chemotaxis protein